MLQQDSTFVQQFIHDLVDIGLFVLLDDGTKLTSNALLSRMSHVEKVRDARREAGLASALRRQQMRLQNILSSKPTTEKSDATNVQQNSNNAQQSNKIKSNKIKSNNKKHNNVIASTDVEVASTNVEIERR
jgi:hypothetical protein